MSHLREAVIASPVRTPVGRFGGVLASLSAADLGAAVIRALLERTGLDPDRVDDVVFGQCNPNGEAPAIGRVAALDAGMPTTTPGLQLDRRCGSGLQAVLVAAMEVQTGAADLVIAGGAESMSQVEHYALGLRSGIKGPSAELHDRLARARTTAGGRDHQVVGGMVETAENLRARFDISRSDQDELALASHHRAVAAHEAGRFDAELVPVTVQVRGGPSVVDRDEHPRSDTSIEQLAGLKPVMRATVAGATVTAGNSSGQNDGASACVVTTPATAEALGLQPLARLVSWATAGVAPAEMGLGPVPATAKALAKTGLTLGDIDLIEINEAFAAQVLACTQSWNLGAADFARINVNGSGISIGHPVGATGGRILATLLHEMARREARYGLETMCIGGGQGISALFERIE